MFILNFNILWIMNDIYIYLCFSVKKPPGPKCHPGKDPDYLQMQDRILGEGENKGNIRQHYIITVLLVALFSALENTGGFLNFHNMALQKDQEYKYQWSSFCLVTVKLLGKNPPPNQAQTESCCL